MAPRSVVVTGASTGIGRATVIELVSAGFHVFPTVRRETDAEGLRRQFPEVVSPLIMDLLDEDSVRAAGEVVSSSGALFGLVNNAGAAFPGPLELIPIEVFRRSIHISPFWEEDLGALAGLIGDERVLFGSDYPHPEGLAEPATYIHQLAGVADETVRKIMGGNLARLMNVDDAAVVR